jgi:hypothetical protein
VGHWGPDRWTRLAGPDQRRGDLMYALIQELADAGARAERRSPRDVPRLSNDLVLPDQLRVVAVDLVAASPDDEVLDHATRLVTKVAREL